MSQPGSFRDHVAVEASHAHTQLLFVSTMSGGTTLVRSDGKIALDPDSPFFVLGHFAEGDHLC